MITGATLIYGPIISMGTFDRPHDHPWPGGPRREFERGSVRAIGKLRRWGDSVVRYVVRLADGAEVQVIGAEQSVDDQRWLAKEARLVPLACTSRDTPWTLSWRDLSPTPEPR